MIRVNLAISPYCFLVSVFGVPTNVYVTLHSRKFPASHRYIHLTAFPFRNNEKQNFVECHVRISPLEF